MWSRLRFFLNPNDGRFEDLLKGDPVANLARDFGAGLVVALVAIPLAMGMAIASGLRPEQGIVGGAVAGFVGALFGGSKYQVYGPTAAFIPIIAGIVAAHGHSFLVTASLVAGVILAVLGLLGAGKVVRLVPHSIVVGFTIGIAITIAMSQLGEVLGLKAKLGYDFFEKIDGLWHHFGTLEIEAVALALITLALTRMLAKVSPFLPAPLVALGVGVVISESVLRNAHLPLVSTKFGAIPPVALVLTPPSMPELTSEGMGELAYASLAIVFVAAIESLLCSRMADRLAGNTGTPFNPDKELWGQGMVMALVPLLNGFPHTGALARTATNIKLGALSPMAGVFKACLKLLIAWGLAEYLGRVPMACIGGILLYVATNMVKREEVDEVFHLGRGHVWLMAFTAIGVIVTDFLVGVVSALVVYGAWQLVERLLQSRRPVSRRAQLAATAAAAGDHGTTPSWAMNIGQVPSKHRTVYVHPSAVVVGRVVMGPHVHLSHGVSVRADEGTPFHIGAWCNLQDGVVLHALKERHVLVHGERWAIHLGERVSLAHQALVHGPTAIGDDCFVGFKAVVHDSVLGHGCFVGHGASVIGVTLAPNRLVAHGSVIDNQAAADALPEVSEAHRHFNDDVVDVNRGLVEAYRDAVRPPVRVSHPNAGPAGFEPTSRAAFDRF